MSEYGEKLKLDIRFVRVLKKLEGMESVLDVGSGNGKLALHLLREGKKVDLFDNTDEYMAKFRELTTNEKLDYHFYLDDITNPEHYHLLTNQYDAVVACEVIEHIPKYKRAIKNMMAFAKKKVVLTTPIMNCFYSPTHVHDFNYDSFDFLDYQFSIEKSYTKKADISRDKKVFIVDIDVTDHKETFV